MRLSSGPPPSSTPSASTASASARSTATRHTCQFGRASRPPRWRIELLGKDVPFFDPGSNMVTWDGKVGTLATTRYFRPASKGTSTRPQRPRHKKLNIRRPSTNHGEAFARQSTPRSSDEAFQLLAKASQYQDDANVCDSIANQVYSAWLARKNNDRLNAANKALEDERKRLEWNARLTAEGTQLDRAAAEDPPPPRKGRIMELPPPSSRGSSNYNNNSVATCKCSPF